MNMERVEPVTGIGPALPAWKAGALPLSYAGGWCREQIPPTPGCSSFRAAKTEKEDFMRRVVDYFPALWNSQDSNLGHYSSSHLSYCSM